MTQHGLENYRVLRLHRRHASVPRFSLVSGCMARNQNAEVDDGVPLGSDGEWGTGLTNDLPLRVSFTMHRYVDAYAEEKWFRHPQSQRTQVEDG
jgi:hypothetical protein